MTGGLTPTRLPTALSVFMMIIGAIGFFVTMMLNAFVLDDFDAYGEVPVPGSGQVQLPAGQAQISFHTTASKGFPIPPLTVSIIPPEGVADPVLTEDQGGRATINKDAHVRIWTVDIREAGTYAIRTDGQVNGYINPTLAFGKDSGPDYLPWVFGTVFGLGLVGLMVSLVLRRRHSATTSVPGMREEQLKTIAALRDSGALTQDEFDAEKRRILGE